MAEQQEVAHEKAPGEEVQEPSADQEQQHQNPDPEPDTEQDEPEQETPAPAVEIPEPEMATADDLRAAGRQFVHTLSNGKSVRLRTITLNELVAAGHLPNELTRTVLEASEKYADRDLTKLSAKDLDDDEADAWFRLLRYVAVLATLEPRIVLEREEAEEDSSAIYVGDVDDLIVVEIAGVVLGEKKAAVDPFVRS